MRIRNKELRQRRHRKEKRIKALRRQLMAEAAARSGGAPEAKTKAVAKKASAVKAEAKPKKATTAAASGGEAPAKPKKTTRKKAEETAAPAEGPAPAETEGA